VGGAGGGPIHNGGGLGGFKLRAGETWDVFGSCFNCDLCGGGGGGSTGDTGKPPPRDPHPQAHPPFSKIEMQDDDESAVASRGAHCSQAHTLGLYFWGAV